MTSTSTARTTTGPTGRSGGSGPAAPAAGTPAVAGTVPELLRRAVERHAGRTALVDGASGERLSYGELGDRVGRAAAWLAADGLAPGDRIAMWGPNTPAWAVLALGALQAGGVVTTLNPAAAEREVAAQVADAQASVVVTPPPLVPAALRLGVRRVVVLGQAAGAVAVADLLAAPGREPAGQGTVQPDALALLPYSSGTTGLPKGVMLTHANLVSACRQTQVPLQLTPDDVTLALAPWFHILGFTAQLLLPLAAGATVVTQSRPDPVALLDLAERHRATYLVVPPPVATFLARSPEVPRRDLRSLTLVASGGAPLHPAVHEELARRLPWCAIGQGWGLTETTGAVSVPRRGEGSPPGTVGSPLPDTELRVVDPVSGADVGPGEDGELWVRGPQVMPGYLRRPQATADMLDGQGWLRTGDLGHVRGDGSVVVVDRLKELIKVNAFQVSPTELEALLLSHPAVADVAVVGVPDERTGEAPVALVVPTDRGRLAPDVLMDWLAERVSPYKRLRAVHEVDALPRTPSGKLLRRLLAPPAALAGTHG